MYKERTGQKWKLAKIVPFVNCKVRAVTVAAAVGVSLVKRPIKHYKLKQWRGK